MAQQSTTQATILMELQALRAEVAELRDMDWTELIESETEALNRLKQLQKSLCQFYTNMHVDCHNGRGPIKADAGGRT